LAPCPELAGADMEVVVAAFAASAVGVPADRYAAADFGMVARDGIKRCG